MANRNGIPRIEATGVTVNADNIVYSFQPNAFFNRNFAGLILFKLPSYTAPSTAVPIIFDGKSQSVTTLNGVSVTSGQLNEAGVYLAFYDGSTLQLLTGI